ncbi:MAG TPA: class II aldolase/adducin family protein [Actinomycetota bacterium]|nr:class II aldolase/adducin family protein [Actinomycetota bacterium]
MSDPTSPREQVSLGCRVLGAEGHGDLVWGHVSARDPGGRGVWMKAAALGFDEVTPAHVLLVSPDGEILEGEGRRHAEFPIHTEVVRARPDVGAVVHTHAPHAVAFAALEVPLRPISHEGTLFVPPDVARFTRTGDLIVTPELGREVAEALGPRNALLLVNHGIVTVGPDVPTAVLTALLLERACRTQLLAMAAGELRRWSSDEEALAKRDRCYPAELLAQAWAYLVRRLG